MDMASRFGRAALALAAVLAVGTPAWGKTETVGGVEWSYDVSNGAATVTGAYPASGALTVPSKLGGYTVKTIGEYALSGSDELTELTLPEGVKSIGEMGVAWCWQLEKVTLPSSLATIGNQAFAGCQLGTVSIPSGVTSMGTGAFSGCTNLSAITVAADNQKFSSVDGVLYSKSKDKLICCPPKKEGAFEVPGTVKTIGGSAFSYCDKLTSVNIPSGVTGIEDGAFAFCTSLVSVAIPGSVKSIGGWSFSNCEKLAGLVLPEGVASIGERAFGACGALTAMAIPESVTSIGDYAFHECGSLSSITVAAGNSKFKAVDGILYNKSKEKLLCCPAGKTGSVAISSSTKSLAQGAFYYCTNVTAVSIPGSVSSFGESAFEGCGLKSAVLPKGLTTIASRLFCRCYDLESVTIPDTVTTIAPWAFNSCESLQSLTLPKKLKSIGWKTFEWCLSLPELTIPDSVTSVGDWTFNWCTNLSSLTIGKGLTKIEAGLFYECSGLTEVTIPDNVKTIGESAFGRCTGLVRVSIGSGLSGIGDEAFNECDALSEITVASGNANFASAGGVLFTKSKDTLVLYPPGKAGAYEIPPGVKRIDKKAFDECRQLTAVKIPDSVKNIGDEAFSDCSELSLARIGGGVTNIGPSAFAYCALGVLTIPGSVKEIGEWALACDGLKTVLAPASWEGTDKLDGAGLPEECRVVYGKVPEDGETATTGQPVPYAWLKEKGLGVDGTLEGFEEGAWSKAANGRPAWECYVAGLDLEDPEDDLLAVLSKEDGVWRVRPKGGEKPGLTYRVMGAAELEDYEYWRDVTDETALEYGPWRFFRIEVPFEGDGFADE